MVLPSLSFIFLFAHFCLHFFQIAQYRLLFSGFGISPTQLLLFIHDLCCSLILFTQTPTHSSAHFKSPPSFTSKISSRLNFSDSIFADLDRIFQWEILNIVKFNSLKSHITMVTRLQYYFRHSQLLQLYIGLSFPAMECLSYIWEVFDFTLLLDRMSQKTKNS